MSSSDKNEKKPMASTSMSAAVKSNNKRSCSEGSSRSGSNKRLKATPSSSSNTVLAGQNVRVVARVRPLSTKETNEHSKQAIRVVITGAQDDDNGNNNTLDHIATSIQVDTAALSRNNSANKTFDYDACFGPNTTQQQLYQHTVGDLVKNNIFKGFNVTVMAYGQTGSGKTFTMGTEGGAAVNMATSSNDGEPTPTLVPPADSDGVIPRAVYDLFDTRRSLPQGEDRVSIEMSYLEIYNEEARDLLADNNTNSSTGGEATTTTLHIRDRPDGVIVQGLSTKAVKCPQDVSTLMNQAALKRATASTAMNAVSSRSHAICTLHVTIAPLTNAVTSDDALNLKESTAEASAATAEMMKAKLTLVDLAGSERIKRTGAEGKRMKEGININKGLFVLGQVVSALSELGQQGSSAANSTNNNSHIPYRDSKLTRLLQDSLGGNSRTVMVACISPADSNVEESINTLRYAQRTRNIQNAARRNVVATQSTMTAAEGAALKRENQMLKQQLAQAQSESQAQMQVDSTNTDSNASSGNPTTGTDNNNTTSPNVLTSKTEMSMKSSGFDISKLDMVKRLQSTISSLECKVEALEEQQQSTADDVLEASVRADKWQFRYERLAATAKDQGITLPDFTANANKDDHDDDDKSSGPSMDLLSQLRKEISDLKSDLHEALSDAAIARATAAAVVAGNGDFEAAEKYATTNGAGSDTLNTSTDDNSDNEGNDDNESAKEEKLALTAELVAVNGGIEAKEAMALQLNRERECMEAMRCHFESAVQSLQEEVDTLSTERENLLSKVKGGDGDRNDGKAKDEDLEGKKRMKKRINELEARIKELRHKAEEHTKSLRLREAAEKKCEKLAAEIQADKKRRVDLQKQLKEQASERRSEKNAAKKEAMKLMRDSNRLKVELEKVKNAAAKQAAVLRRKATEAVNKQKRDAELQAKRQQNQDQRKHVAAMKANAKDKKDESSTSAKKYSFSNSNGISDERKNELLEWLEQEISSAYEMKGTQDQIKEQRRLMNDAIAKKAGLSKQNSFSRSSGNLSVNPPTAAMTAYDEEIEMRSSLIEELESNLAELVKSTSSSPRSRSPSPRSLSSSSCFLDMNLYHGLTKPEATAIFLRCFDRLLEAKKEMEKIQTSRESATSRAVQSALTKERRASEEKIMQLKMDHSQAMMDLLNSTKGSIEQSVRLNSLNSVVDPEFQSTVEEMLGSYLQGCSRVGESLQGDLQEVRKAHEGMQQMVTSVAGGLFGPESQIPSKKSRTKKKSKKRDSSDSILEEIKLLEMDEADEDADNSDDSDWSPSNKTPGPKRRSRRSADSVNGDGKRRSSDGQNDEGTIAVKRERSMVSVAEENQVTTKEPATVSFAINDTSMDASHPVDPKGGEGNVLPRDDDTAQPTESVTDYANLKVRELKDLLRSRGLLVSGIKNELIERLEEDDRKRLGLMDASDRTGQDENAIISSAKSKHTGDWSESKENLGRENQSRHASTRTRRAGGGLQNRDLNRTMDSSDNGKTSAKVALPDTPPKSTKKGGGWSTKKIASVRRSTIFSTKKRSPSPNSSASLGSSPSENEENASSSVKRPRKDSLKTLRTRRNLDVQLGNGI